MVVQVMAGLVRGLLVVMVLMAGCTKAPVELQKPGAIGIPAYLAEYDATRSEVDLNLLFIHHSCGSNWLAPENGGLRTVLERQGFRVHSATYGSKIGQQTDMVHWVPKFQQHMDLVLRTRKQDELLPEGKTNQVVMFKSCFPNSNIHGPGEKPAWDPLGVATVGNFKLVYQALKGIFANHPKVLFIAVTAPPLRQEDTSAANAANAKEFNHWLVHEWPKGQKNVAVFDFFGVLRTGEGYLNYPTADSHPNRLGNRRATAAFGPFLYRALRRAGLL